MSNIDLPSREETLKRLVEETRAENRAWVKRMRDMIAQHKEEIAELEREIAIIEARNE